MVGIFDIHSFESWNWLICNLHSLLGDQVRKQFAPKLFPSFPTHSSLDGPYNPKSEQWRGGGKLSRESLTSEPRAEPAVWASSMSRTKNWRNKNVVHDKVPKVTRITKPMKRKCRHSNSGQSIPWGGEELWVSSTDNSVTSSTALETMALSILCDAPFIIISFSKCEQ